MVREVIEEVGASLLFLPPDSPEFSPIENFWSKEKALVIKVKARNYKDLIDAITSSFYKLLKKIFATGLPIVITVPHSCGKCYIQLYSVFFIVFPSETVS